MYIDLMGANHNKVEASWPQEDGPAYVIPWDTNSPGFRVINIANGTDTIAYLMETTAAADGVGNSRDYKLYSFNLKTKELTYLHTAAISKTPGSQPSYDCNEGFYVNVSAGYYTVDVAKTLYVLDLVTGVQWGSLAMGTSLDGLTGGQTTIVSLLNGVDFCLLSVYGSNISNRHVIVNTTSKTVSWGTPSYTSIGGTPTVYPCVKDTRAGSPENRLIALATFYTGSYPNLYYYIKALYLDIGGPEPILTAGNTSTNLSSAAAYGLRNIIGNSIYCGGGTAADMQFYIVNPDTANFAAAAQTSWGTCTTKSPYSFVRDNTKPRTPNVIYDQNQDVWFCTGTPNVGTFGSPKFRASTLIAGIVLAGYSKDYSRAVKLVNKGFFYAGKISNTTKVAPVIFYYVAS